MKIVFFEIQQWEIPFLREHLSAHELVFFAEPLQEADVSSVTDADALCVFIYSQVTRAVLEKFSQVTCIATRSTGYDHIDLVACKERSILVSTVPTYGENTVAEHTFALLLAISRHIPESLERVKKGSFSVDGLKGFDLKGRTLGVIGVGSIGKHVIRIAAGFEMHVLGYDPYPKEGLAETLGFTYTSLEELLAQSDIITLHCPYTKHTHHLLNEESLATLKPGCVIINTARGALIDNDALVKALKNGLVSWVALDVLEEEGSIREEAEILSDNYTENADLRRLLADHVLLRHPRVFITPHNAFNSDEAIQRILETTIKNLLGFSQGQPINTVALSSRE